MLWQNNGVFNPPTLSSSVIKRGRRKRMKTTIIEKNGQKRKATKKEDKELKKTIKAKLALTAMNEIAQWKQFLKDLDKNL